MIVSTQTKQQYAEWLQGIGFTHTATIRSVYPLTQMKMDKYLNSILKNNRNIDYIYSVIEPDTDPYSKAQDNKESYITTKTSTGNHAHLLLRYDNVSQQLKAPKNTPYTIPYYDKVEDLHRITNYLVKYQTENNYNLHIK